MVGSTAVSSDKGVVMGGLSWSGQQPSHLTRVLWWGSFMVGSTAVSSDKGVVMGGLSWSGQRPSHLTRVL